MQTAAAESIARQLADMDFSVSVTLAYAWAFDVPDSEGDETRFWVGMEEARAWEGDHPREVQGERVLPGGYAIDVYGFDPQRVEDVGFVGVRPDGTEVELSFAEVEAIVERYGAAIAEPAR